MMCPKKLFFGILSGVVLMPLQSSALGPMADELPAAKVVAKHSREHLGLSDLERFGISISHEIKPRQNGETQFKLIVRAPLVLDGYLHVEPNLGEGSFNISLRGVPEDVLNLKSPDEKKLEGKKFENGRCFWPANKI